MPPTPPRTAADVLATAAPLATRWIERLLAAHDPPLTVAQFLALRAISTGRTAAVDLARGAGVSPAAVSQLVAELDRTGLLERTQGSVDRRRQELGLSRTGQDVLASASAALGEQLGAVVGGLPRPEQEALARLLGRVEDVLRGAAPPPRPPRRPGPPPRR